MEVYIVLDCDLPEEAKNTPHIIKSYETKLLTIDGKNGFIQIYPICTLMNRSNFMQSKYEKIRYFKIYGERAVHTTFDNQELENEVHFISPTLGKTNPLSPNLSEIADSIPETPNTPDDIEQILRGLPNVFTKNYIYGLGLARKYRHIVHAIESLTNCEGIVISKTSNSRVEGREFVLSLDLLEIVRKTINRTINYGQNAVRSVSSTSVYNLFAPILEQPEIPVRIGGKEQNTLIVKATKGEAPLDKRDHDLVLNIVSSNSRDLIQNRGEKVVNLTKTLELDRIARLIEDFKRGIDNGKSESYWQRLFEKNAFVLSFVFSSPYVFLREKAFVGGYRLDGRGGRFADFLYHHRITGNVAIIEIKKPGTALLKKRPYRNEVYSPSSELVGSVSQILDQRFELINSNLLKGLQVKGGIEIRPYWVECVLLLGTLPCSEHERRSLELFRGSLKDVTLITFEELLKKIELVYESITSDSGDRNSIVSNHEVPF